MFLYFCFSFLLISKLISKWDFVFRFGIQLHFNFGERETKNICLIPRFDLCSRFVFCKIDYIHYSSTKLNLKMDSISIWNIQITPFNHFNHWISLTFQANLNIEYSLFLILFPFHSSPSRFSRMMMNDNSYVPESESNQANNPVPFDFFGLRKQQT